MLAIRLTARRCIHSTRHCYYNFKLSEVQTEKVLSVVNSSTVEDLTERYGLSKTRANKLHFGRQQISRSVTSIDELFTIGGFSENVLHRFCKKILYGGDSADINDDGTITAPRILSHTTPKISDNVISQIKSFTAIQCGLTGLAWCTFVLTPNALTNITHWEWRPLPQSKLSLHLMASFISNALKAVPQSDFYVFENPVATNVGSSQKVNLNVQLSNMIGMASVLVAQRSTLLTVVDEEINDESINNVAYLRKYLYARLFKLYVGTEQISSNNYVDTLLRWSQTSTVLNEDVQTLVQVEDDLKSSYASSESQVKELLSCTLLTGLAFLRLNVLKCPKSYEALKERSKKKIKLAENPPKLV
ncbi:uncharacterized protein LOC119071769 isoform X1 [Bradysia coprophila]|uniref:uncharacterized protein LOC119071769 isoform X1 n=1 Tax=Bradysia coprophila TaxID=38358 RepID=UPI00187DC7B0|nr:uncharacterized protein LOC119071769 isoform X1 [Bradysia coprophila]